jgi:CopG family transcriptional regulator, nickel-responsive regulator
MERITMSIDEGLAREFDLLIKRRAYSNPLEAMREIVKTSDRVAVAGRSLRLCG